MLSSGRYRHYKGNYYDVLGVALDSETEEEYVVYRPRYGDRRLWIRPLTRFLDPVVVDGAEIPRFAYEPEPV